MKQLNKKQRHGHYLKAIADMKKEEIGNRFTCVSLSKIYSGDSWTGEELYKIPKLYPELGLFKPLKGESGFSGSAWFIESCGSQNDTMLINGDAHREIALMFCIEMTR